MENGQSSTDALTCGAPFPALERSEQTLGVRACAVLVLLSLAILVPGIQVSLFDRDEGWYAEVAREMVQTGDWLVPRYLGEVWLAKPPLLYWLVGASFKLLGMGEWQARLVSVLAGTAGVLLVAALGARIFGRRVGLLAAIIFITAGLPSIVGKMLLTDSLLLAMVLAAVLLHWSMADCGVTHCRAGAYWLFIGLGVLAKGPAVLIFAGTFGLALLAAGRQRWVRSGRFWLWLPVCVLVAAPWYIYIATRAEGTFVRQFLWFEIVSRIASAPHGHSGPPGYHMLVSVAGLLPWTVFVPGMLVLAWRQRRGDSRIKLMLVWLAVPWIVLELVRSKLPHYILPCYVPLAILLGRELDAAISAARPWSALSRGERCGLELWTLPLMIAGVGSIALACRRCGVWAVAAVLAGLILLCGFATVRLMLRRHGIGRAFLAAVVTMVALHTVLGSLLLPKLEPFRLSRRLAETMNSYAGPGERVYLAGYEEPSTFFYLSSSGRTVAPEQVEGILRPDERTLLAVSDDAMKALGPDTLSRFRTVAGLSGYNYVKMKDAIIWIGWVGDISFDQNDGGLPQ